MSRVSIAQRIAYLKSLDPAIAQNLRNLCCAKSRTDPQNCFATNRCILIRMTRKCSVCHETYVATGEPDPCLGKLSGCIGACCGHGDVERCYVAKKNGVVIVGSEAITEQLRLKAR